MWIKATDSWHAKTIELFHVFLFLFVALFRPLCPHLFILWQSPLDEAVVVITTMQFPSETWRDFREDHCYRECLKAFGAYSVICNRNIITGIRRDWTVGLGEALPLCHSTQQLYFIEIWAVDDLTGESFDQMYCTVVVLVDGAIWNKFMPVSRDLLGTILWRTGNCLLICMFFCSASF